MGNDLGFIWKEMLMQLDIKDLHWLSDNNVFKKNDNKFVQQMNEMLLARLDEVKVDV